MWRMSDEIVGDYIPGAIDENPRADAKIDLAVVMNVVVYQKVGGREKIVARTAADLDCSAADVTEMAGFDSVALPVKCESPVPRTAELALPECDGGGVADFEQVIPGTFKNDVFKAHVAALGNVENGGAKF